MSVLSFVRVHSSGCFSFFFWVIVHYLLSRGFLKRDNTTTKNFLTDFYSSFWLCSSVFPLWSVILPRFGALYNSQLCGITINSFDSSTTFQIVSPLHFLFSNSTGKFKLVSKMAKRKRNKREWEWERDTKKKISTNRWSENSAEVTILFIFKSFQQWIMPMFIHWLCAVCLIPFIGFNSIFISFLLSNLLVYFASKSISHLYDKFHKIIFISI